MLHLDLSHLDRSNEKLMHFLQTSLASLFCTTASPPVCFCKTLIFLSPCLPFSIPYHHLLPPFYAGERVLASGSVQLPRFTLLESGSLLISPSHLSDAGTYTCMASNSRGIDEASADLLVWGKHNRN